MLRAGILLSAASGVEALLGLVRNIFVARLIGVENFGIAATFLLSVSGIMAFTSLSVDRLVVQSPDGDDHDFVASVQSFETLRCLFNAAVLFAMAWPLSAFFGNPELLWAYQLTALAPLLTAFKHLDVLRYQRRLRFGPEATVNVGTAAICLIVAWPTAVWLGDYRVMIVQLVLAAGLKALISQLLAERRFRLGWRRELLGRAFDFGWPLAISGMLTFFILQGDRIIIGNRFGAYELGLFSAALMLAMTPALLADHVLRQLFLPKLSRLQDRRPAFESASVATIQMLLFVGSGMLVGFLALGREALLLIYGEQYAGAGALLGWVTLVFALRLMRAGPTTVALSGANTKNLMYANLTRLISLPVAFLAAIGGADMTTVVAISAAGELCSLVLAFVLLARRPGIARLDRLGAPYGCVAVLVAACGLIAQDPPMALFAFDWRHGLAAASFLALVGVCAEMRAQILAEIRRVLGSV